MALIEVSRNGNPLDTYSFHDNKLHSIAFAAEAENFASEIHLDIDHIVRWPSCKSEEEEKFVLSKAKLIFFDVNNLGAVRNSVSFR